MLRSLIPITLITATTVIGATAAHATDLQKTIRNAQRKVVKIYGAGGLRQMEAYQTGIVVSADGHVLTAMSYVLDTDDLAVMLDDGRKWQAEFVGSDPLTELALLKLPDEASPIPFFDLQQAGDTPKAAPGERILALSNLYGIATGDEPVSVLQGVVTAIAPLRARRGAYRANYRDNVYVLDAYANNPGAAGGALVDWEGNLLGILGKELRSEVTGTWLNYALPTASFSSVVVGSDCRPKHGRADRHGATGGIAFDRVAWHFPDSRRTAPHATLRRWCAKRLTRRARRTATRRLNRFSRRRTYRLASRCSATDRSTRA